MREKQKGVLPYGSYGEILGKDFKPYISKDENMSEITVSSIFIGLMASIIFAMSTTYLGLKVGMTISAGIPASILGVGILKALKRNSVLQGNVIQSMASMGEGVAAGVLFILAALFLWRDRPINYAEVMIVLLSGGILGVFLGAFFRRFLLVEEHGKELKFPESMAISEVIVNASDGEGKGFKTVLQGILAGGLFKIVGQGLGFVKEVVNFRVWRTEFSIEIFTSLLALGYIVGIRLSSALFAGGLLSWFGLIPLISFLGEHFDSVIAPGTKLISEMSPSEIWSSYIRYIGAGVVTFGGFISLGRNLPSIVKSLLMMTKNSGDQEKSNDSGERSDQNTPMKWILIVLITVTLCIWLIPILGVGFLPSIAVLFFSFIFASVSGRMVGILGSSNNPISGMTIAALLMITSLLKLLGFSGQEAMIQAILLGSIVCCGVAVAGGYFQSLKVGFIFGGTTKKINLALLLAVSCSGIISFLTLFVLDKAYGIGSAEAAAPQAHLMKVIVEGIFGGNLPWDLIFIGGMIAIAAAVAGLPALVIGLGMYLPLGLSVAIFIGGILGIITNNLNKKASSEGQEEASRMGMIFASGIIAGESIAGMLIAVLLIAGVNLSIAESIFSDTVITIVTLAVFMFVATLLVLKAKAGKLIK